jgi:tetratricopeptide (TPR) repeat protein
MQTIRVFISSPSDLAPERAAAGRVIERLRRQFHGRAIFEPFLWEYDSYESSKPFQAQIPRAGEFDIVVVMLWSKLGRPIVVDGETYPSGTVYEYFDALRAAEAGKPRLLVYRKTAEPPTSYRSQSAEQILDAKSKFDEVERFFQENFDNSPDGVRGFNKFETPDSFEEALEKELRKYVDTLRSSSKDQAPAEESPYRGLKLFDEEHQHFFFGRTRAVHQVVACLQRQAAAGRPFVLVFGRSGVGKSSFIRAGIAPYLTGANVIEDVCCWRRVVFEPSDSTDNLVGGLALAICAPDALPEVAQAAGGKSEFARLLRSNPEAATALVKECLRQAAVANGGGPTKPARLLVLIDPLEEIFTCRTLEDEITPDVHDSERQEQGQREFARVLHQLCDSGVMWVIATLRSDFYERVSAIQELRTLIEGEGQYHLDPLTPTEIAQAVTLPAEIAGVQFEECQDRGSLASEIVDAALNHTDPLPLLSYTLDQLYERSDAAHTGLMTFKAFDQLGRVDGALSRRADEALSAARERMTGKLGDCLDKFFGLLVDIDRDGRRVRIYASADKFDDHDTKLLKDELDHARLLIYDMDDQHNPVESIAHETILRRWSTLRDWIDDREEQLRLRNTLESLSRDWAPTRDPELLVLEGARLARAEQFINEPRGLNTSMGMREFVRANTARRDEAARRTRNRVRLAFGAISTLFVLAFAAFCYVLYQEQKLSQEQQATQRVSDDLHDILAYMLTVLDERLDTHNENERQLRDEIGKRVAEHYQQVDLTNGSPEWLEKVSDEMAKGAGMLREAHLEEPASVLMRRSIEVGEASNRVPPMILAQRWETLGDLFYRRSLYDDQANAYQKSLDIRAAHQLPDSQLARAGLARHLKAKGQFAQAADQLQNCIKVLRAAGPDMEDELAEQYDALGDILRNLRRFDECEKVSNLGIELAKKLARGAPPKSSRSLAVFIYQSEYAVLLQKRNRLPDAEKLLLEIRDNYGEVDQNLGRILYKLARVQIEMGKLDEAEASLTESYRQMKPNETPMAKCLEARARLRLAQKKYADAESDIRDALRIRENALSGPHPDLFEAQLILVEVLEAQGRSDAARPVRDKALVLQAEFEKQMNGDSPQNNRQAASR